MESTAPIGGLRISDHLYNILDKAGVVSSYLDRFRREALAMGSSFREISKEELFRFSRVTLADKKNVQFDTYSVQVSPGLPEAIAEQVALLLARGDNGADRIIDFLKYYRGNRFVIGAVEEVFNDKKAPVVLRKEDILQHIAPDKHAEILGRNNHDKKKSAAEIRAQYSLYDLLELLGEYQDKVNALSPYREFKPEFKDYDQYVGQQNKILKRMFLLKRKATEKRLFFYDVVYPLVFRCIRTSILEHQVRHPVVEERKEA
jgi:hypothetical protein